MPNQKLTKSGGKDYGGYDNVIVPTDSEHICDSEMYMTGVQIQNDNGYGPRIPDDLRYDPWIENDRKIRAAKPETKEPPDAKHRAF